MIACEPFSRHGPAGIADALQKLDCTTAEATAVSFGRLFGANGNFAAALTILLTLYVAFFAISLLIGRSSLKASVLTPRMLTLGLVLTFVTSWVAYQSVVWNLAVGGPDEIASKLVGSDGSATVAFAARLDVLFEVITSAAQSGSPQDAAAPALMSPSNILSLAAIVLLLGTVGVLAVCRLALAALLILGPVFIVLALFEGTRGLFQGWLKSVVLFACVPLLTVLLGSGALYAITPMVKGIASGGSEITLRTAVSIFVASVVYVALMVTSFKVAGTLTRGWQTGRAANELANAAHLNSVVSKTDSSHLHSNDHPAMRGERVRSAVAALEANSHQPVSSTRVLATTSSLPFENQWPASFANNLSPSQRISFRSKPNPNQILPKGILQ